MEYIIEDFDKYNDDKVKKITLRNDIGTTISMLSYGACWYEYIPKNGQNVILNHSSTNQYFEPCMNVGQTIGPVAGRIANGEYSIADSIYFCEQNQGRNCLHSGSDGFHSVNWKYDVLQSDDSLSCVFNYTYKGVLGVDTTLAVKIVFEINNNDEVIINFRGENVGDNACLFNPTNHTYFNISDSQTVDSLQLQIKADKYLELKADSIPTGNMLEVHQSDYDFLKPRNLMSAIEQHGGYDDAFVVSDYDEVTLVLIDEKSNKRLEISTDRNCYVVYTTNGMDRGVRFVRDGEHDAVQYEAIAIEPQTLPDAVNQSGFGNIILKPGEFKEYTVVYKLYS